MERIVIRGTPLHIVSDNKMLEIISLGKHLIPWLGNNSRKIDRYDIRNLLEDEREIDGLLLEPKKNKAPFDFKERLTFQRYRDLFNESDSEEEREKEKKRRRTEESNTSFHAVPFSYSKEIKEETLNPNSSAPFSVPFPIPPEIPTVIEKIFCDLLTAS